MKRTRFIRATALFLAVLMFCGVFCVTAAASEPGSSTSSSMTAEEMKELLNSDSYEEYLTKHPATKGEGEVVIDAKEVYSYSDGSVTYYYDASTKSFYKLGESDVRVDVAASDVAVSFGTYGGEEAVLSPASGALTWEVTIPTSGRYAVEIEYYPVGTNATSIERMFYIDGKVPFSQARYLTMSKIWEYSYLEDTENGFKTDKNGNELKPSVSLAPEWLTYRFSDSNGFHHGAFEFYMTSGTHRFSLEASREAMAIKSIRVFPYEGAPSYADVLASYQANGYQTAGKDSYVSFEAERPYRVSDTSVYAANDRSSAATFPSDASAQLLNVLGSNSYDTVGQWASYRFSVNKTGLYTISVRCKQDELAGMYTSRAIRLAGGIYGEDLDVPFQEAYNARFDYNKSWQIATLGDGTNVFQFYFEEGQTYTISLEVSLGSLSTIIQGVENSLNVINNCYLEILKLTGAEPDQYRDYNFSRVMPQTIRNLLREHKNLTSVSTNLTNLCNSKGAHVATLDKVSYLLEIMGSQEDKIAENLGNLKSYIGTLGTWLNTSKQQSLMMDYVVVSGAENTSYEASVSVKLDGKFKENASFFESVGYEIVSFFKSFVTDYNQMGVTDMAGATTRVEAWLATGRDQASIWRNLIDSTFTSTDAGDGIAVDLKLVALGTLLPSVLAKQGPDVYVGLDSPSVINYAIRSAVLPITEHATEDPEILADFNSATLIPVTMYDELYGLPEQVMFPMMFYRKDALANLGLDVPRTWDDLLTCVPVFQSSNMQIGLVRDYHMFLYQRGGGLWKYGGADYADDGEYAELMNDPTFSTYFDYMEVAYDQNVALDAFKYMCRFYSDYSLPVAYDAANRFRTGEMPIVIADAVTMYNQLTVFATEIRGLWMFTNVPGTERSDGSFSNVAIATVNAIVMMNGVEDTDATWKFMKWLVGAEVQAEYGNNMVSLIGPAAKYATANMRALKMMSWTTEEYNNLYGQFNNLATIPNYPGTYIIDRYLNFAFLNAYEDGADPVEQLQGYIKEINKEINRKREEFELPTLEDGKTIDDAIEAYLAYLKTLSDEDLADYSEYVQNYVKNSV